MNTYKWIPMIICFLLCFAGCSTTHSIDTSSTRTLKKDLKDLSPSIKRVQFTFTRPNLFCRIDMSNEPSTEELESILAEIKEFSTIDNMNEIARSVKWGTQGTSRLSMPMTIQKQILRGTEFGMKYNREVM